MANVIVFDLATRNLLRRPTPSSSFTVMDPIPMTDGRFYLGVEVLADPAHAFNINAAGIRSIPPVDFETIRALTFQAPPRGATGATGPVKAGG